MKELLFSIKQQLQNYSNLIKNIDYDIYHSINKRNSIIIHASAYLTLIIECYYIFRVLFLTNSGLGTLNNRIHFGFYITLSTLSLSVLFFQRYWKYNLTAQYYLNFFTASAWLIWNLLFNTYELHKDPYNSKILFVTALIFFSILLRFRLRHTLSIQLIAYILFITLNHNTLDIGDILNTSTNIFVAMFISTILLIQEIRQLEHQQALVTMNEKLLQEEDSLRLALEKHNIMMQETTMISFDWDIIQDILSPSKNCSETLMWPEHIKNPRQWILENCVIYPEDKNAISNAITKCLSDKNSVSIDLRIYDYHKNYTWYRLHLFVQCNHHQIATTVLGTLFNIDGTARLIANINTHMQMQIDNVKEYISELKDSQEKTVIYRHDMKHSLRLMEQLAHQGNMTKLLDYLNESQNNLESITPESYCENETVNLIIGSFVQSARKANIAFDSKVILPQDLPLSDTDLCSLFFNLLENAMTAAKKTADDTLRRIYIKAVINHNSLLIFTENGHDGNVIIENDIPLSTQDSTEHGYGIQSIITITERYNGMYTFETKEQIFYARIMLLI